MNRELAVIENGLVPVYETSTGEKVVYGTELHKALGLKTKFADWIKRRLQECDADKNEDYDIFLKNEKNSGAGRPQNDYILSLDIAKEMAMLERNEKGKQVRRYFIQVEKKYKAAQAALAVQNEKIGKFIDVQAEFNEKLMDRLAKIEKHNSIRSSLFEPVSDDTMKQRLKKLNELVDQVAGLYGMNRGRVLHLMYMKLQEHFGISFNSYLQIVQFAKGSQDLGNLHVIASVDRLYEAAIDMNEFTIDKKKLYG